MMFKIVVSVLLLSLEMVIASNKQDFRDDVFGAHRVLKTVDFQISGQELTQIVIDLTERPDRCLPWAPQWLQNRQIYRLGLKTLTHKDAVDKKIVYGIGSDEDAVRRWTIVAQGIIQADNNDWCIDCCCADDIRPSEWHAKLLRQALSKRSIKLDNEIECALSVLDRLE